MLLDCSLGKELSLGLGIFRFLVHGVTRVDEPLFDGLIIKDLDLSTGGLLPLILLPFWGVSYLDSTMSYLKSLFLRKRG
jgi:hypothetical protein